MIRSMVKGEGKKPVIWDLGRYALLRPAKGVDYEKTIAASRYAWVLPHISSKPLFEVENMLDRHYYSRLLMMARRLKPRDRSGVLRLINLETSLTNVIWALRLRFSFGLDIQAARPLMIPNMTYSHQGAIAETFEIPAESVEGWRKWKYSWLVEDQFGEAFRAPDPVRAEQKATRRLVQKAHQLCHEDPFTLTPIVAYFKLKELETAMLKIAVEALQLQCQSTTCSRCWGPTDVSHGAHEEGRAAGAQTGRGWNHALPRLRGLPAAHCGKWRADRTHPGRA